MSSSLHFRILVIGSTGNGKSTLCNVISDSNKFHESNLMVSATKNYQKETFSIDQAKMEIIDTIGIGDTKLTEKEVLFKIAEACYACREGVNQILFVTSGRFTKAEISSYHLLEQALFDKNICNYTTIVRTNFSGYYKPEKTELDIQSMFSENEEMKRIGKNCNKILHVNNPNDEVDPSLTHRKESRKRVVSHLLMCRSKYLPKNLNELNNRIKGHMSEQEKISKKMLVMEEEMKQTILKAKENERLFLLKLDKAKAEERGKMKIEFENMKKKFDLELKQQELIQKSERSDLELKLRKIEQDVANTTKEVIQERTTFFGDVGTAMDSGVDFIEDKINKGLDFLDRGCTIQ